jgi:hypothetical protein
MVTLTANITKNTLLPIVKAMIRLSRIDSKYGNPEEFKLVDML